MPIIELKDVSFRYEERGTPALQNINGRLESGSLTAIIGANGSGKSTLGRVIAGLLEPTRGKILSDVSPDTDDWNRRGMLFQYPDEQLISHTVEQELAWGLENLGIAPDEIAKRVEQALKRFRLGDKRDHAPDSLSDGWKQIAALAAVAVMEPDFLVLDEATAFLDKPSRQHVWEQVCELKAEMGVIWISTEADEAVHADNVWLLHGGALVAQGAPDLVLRAEVLEDAGVKPI